MRFGHLPVALRVEPLPRRGSLPDLYLSGRVPGPRRRKLRQRRRRFRDELRRGLRLRLLRGRLRGVHQRLLRRLRRRPDGFLQRRRRVPQLCPEGELVHPGCSERQRGLLLALQLHSGQQRDAHHVRLQLNAAAGLELGCGLQLTRARLVRPGEQRGAAKVLDEASA